MNDLQNSEIFGTHKIDEPDGVHFLMEFFGCARNQIDSIAFWDDLLSEAITKVDITVINKHFHRFTPHGITGYLLLSTSHISIHTWPEYEYVACDVFSCGNEDDTTYIIDYIKDNLTYKGVKTRMMKRGYKIG